VGLCKNCGKFNNVNAIIKLHECMKQVCFIIWLSLLVSCSANTSNKKETIGQKVTKRDYKLIIDDVIVRFSLGKEVSLEELQNAVPITQDEFLVYYSYTYPDKGKAINQSFIKVDNEIGKNAANNQGGFFRLYLELSPFVDGEYAESYFEDVDFIISKNIAKFCEIYSALSDSSKNKLEEYKIRYCK